MGLSYTFLGSDSKAANEVYTPLIIPSSLDFIRDVTINTAGDNVNLPTPFSKIRNNSIHDIERNGLNQNTTTVNVLNDYSWTISPKTSKTGRDASEYSNENYRNVNDETPYIYLKEKYFLVNNIIAQALYSLSVFDGVAPVQALKDFFNSATDFVQGGLRILGDAVRPQLADNGNVSGIEGVIGGEFSSIDQDPNESSFFSATGNTLAEGIKSFNNNIDTLQSIFRKYNNPDLESVLFPYQKLYFVAPTGFEYKIPYLNTRVLDVSNNFGDTAENITGQLINLVNAGTGFTEVVAGTGALLSQAGSAKIERAKHYQYPSEGPPIEVVFPLYNTSPATYEDVKNNFKLVLLLMYQNLPLRQDKVIVEPPALYDVTIPGNRRAPYCYISNLVVNYRGSTRLMNLDMAGINSTDDNISIPEKLKTIVPDMYEIRLTLQPMIASTKNLLFSTISDNVVKTDTKPFVGSTVSSPNSTTETINNRNSIFPNGL